MLKKVFAIAGIGIYLCSLGSLQAQTELESQFDPNFVYISSNPAAVNVSPGSGVLQKYIEKLFDIKNDHGIKFGGAWVGDSNSLFSGGIPDAKRTTYDSSLVLSLTADAGQLMGWQGGLFGIQFLQSNGQNANEQAGVVQGYNSLPGPAPINRSELYQLWYRQSLLDNKLFLRIGKSVPTIDFDNVTRPVALTNNNLNIFAVSGLIFTPLFLNSTTIGVIPGYYNSSYGVTLNYAPVKEWYASAGVYDGNLANGKQTGIKVGPTFNGNYFYIGETGTSWLLGPQKKPGNFGIGIWDQSGPIKGPPTVNEDNAAGIYLFGSQRLWYKNPGFNKSGISAFYQYGINNSDALPMNRYIGGGLTGFGLISARPKDSMGMGVAHAWLNQKSFSNNTETIYQAYYHIWIMNGLYLQPVLSYIPKPGASPDLPPAFAGTLRMIVLF